ncbi:refilin B [Gadus chalcogrammus]|uniref:refilin B n=1 Tax=Gadus chalcogrammus TaxID=1042646 RepID=UPI0024C4B988|nr:refilin B [Gadus chalcogrammus]
MVGRLNLPNLCDTDPLGMSCRAERVLDSPDSGLPPSPSPSAWLLPLSTDKGGMSPVSEDEGRDLCIMPPSLRVGSFPRRHPLSYGEGIELDPLPPKEIRYTSSLQYHSERHFIQDVSMQPGVQGLELCSQTVMALPHSTWRRYKTKLDFQQRQHSQRFRSTIIVYPKHAHSVYTTELSYDCHRLARRFLASVELEAVDRTCRLPQ